MSASQAQASNAPEPARGRGRGVRGRGGGRGLPPSRIAPSAAMAVAKVGPTRVLDAKWAEEQTLRGQSFVIWLGSAQGIPQQVTFHRPIGVTPLRTDQWVATPTAEIPLLLSRRSSEDLNRWERLKSAAQRAAVLASGTGRKMSTGEHPKEVFVVDGDPDCGATIQMAMAAAKAAGKPESAWLDYAVPAVRNAEQLFKAALKSQEPSQQWLAGNPRPTHETRGGPLGDRPQVAVEYLDGSTLARAKDLVLTRLFSSPPTEEEEEEEQEDTPPDS